MIYQFSHGNKINKFQLKKNILRNIQQKTNSQEGLASNLSKQYHPRIKRKGQENKENDHLFEKLLIVKQILIFTTMEKGENSVENINVDAGPN